MNLKPVISSMHIEDSSGKQTEIVNWYSDNSIYQDILELTLADGQVLKIVIDKTVLDASKRRGF
ncbi:hypothetical protein ACRC6Q_16665 [Planococcus sp. SE5232]|uniref:hypothetical protein n=1 Tax=unclassified Planococcus (in: firmicutes) TaxID=2662419 RepID=UPI003D6B45B1